MSVTVIGVDPGGTTGIALLVPDRPVELVQCTPGVALRIVGALGWDACTSTTDWLLIAVERFVVGTRAARSSTPKAGAITRDLIGALAALHNPDVGMRVVQRSAAEVKPWATDERLAALGIGKGMPHARDAARHALFAAVRDCGAPDPLSKKGR